MDDNDEVVCNESYEIIDETSVKIKSQQTNKHEEEVAGYIDLNLDVDEIAETEEYYSALPKLRRGRRSKKSLDTKSQAQTSPSKPNYSTTAVLKLGPRYRPIRPKPVPSVTSKNKLFGIPSAVNVSALSSPNRFIVTSLSSNNKDKIRDVTVLSNSNSKTSSYIKSINSNTGGITAVTKEISGNKNENSNTAVIRKELRNVKIPSRSAKGSIELFFESMAQTVLNLPMQVQAEIKMEICKIVTMAEIKYCGSQSKHKTG